VRVHSSIPEGWKLRGPPDYPPPPPSSTRHGVYHGRLPDHDIEQMFRLDRLPECPLESKEKLLLCACERGRRQRVNDVVLLGDSIFDHAAHVAGGPDVRSQLEAELTPD
jgi:hypothetical protein